MRSHLAVFFLIAVAGNVDAADQHPVRGANLENALAQAGGWQNAPPGSRMCRDANGHTFLSDKPCEVQYRCYDDQGKLYRSASPCPRPRELSEQEMAQNRERARQKREEYQRDLQRRDPIAWQKLEQKEGGDLSQCSVHATHNALTALCPKGKLSESLR